MASALGVTSHVLPATDDRLRTILETDAGELDFQDYFVGHRQEPAVTGIRLDGEAHRPRVGGCGDRGPRRPSWWSSVRRTRS